MGIKSLFGKILVIAAEIYDKFGPIIDMLARVDVTKLNADDRVAFGIAAAEWKQLGFACTDVGNTLDQIKEGGISPEEYVLLLDKLRAVLKEAGDIGPATKNLVD